MMKHVLTNFKFINTKQAGDIYSYINIKRKLHNTIAAIWFHKVKPEAASVIVELLMMGLKTPETC
jgi:hypothetical protein